MGRILVLLLLLGLVACDPCRQVSAGAICEDSQATIPFKKVGWFPTIPAKVDGVPFTLLVDTGASGTFLSATRAGKKQNELGLDVEVLIGGMHIHLYYVWYADSPFSMPEDDNINGLLGNDLLFTLDYQQTQTEIILSEQQLSCTGLVIRAANPRGTEIMLPMIIEQHKIENTLLDTGAALVLLSEKTAAVLPDYVVSLAKPSGYCVFGGCHTSGAFITKLENVCLDTVCLDSIQAKYPAWDAIGQSWLQRHDSFIVSIYRRTLQLCH